MSSTSKEASRPGNRARLALASTCGAEGGGPDAWLEGDAEPGPASPAAAPTPCVPARRGRRKRSAFELCLESAHFFPTQNITRTKGRATPSRLRFPGPPAPLPGDGPRADGPLPLPLLFHDRDRAGKGGPRACVRSKRKRTLRAAGNPRAGCPRPERQESEARCGRSGGSVPPAAPPAAGPLKTHCTTELRSVSREDIASPVEL